MPNFLDITELTHNLLAPGPTPNLLVGAGLSVDADIPLAGKDLLPNNLSVATRAARHKFLSEYKRPPENLEELKAWMQKIPGLTDPARCYGVALGLVANDDAGRRRFLEQFLKGRRPTRSHQIVAEFVTRGYFQSIFTTNFDPLLERSLMFAGIDCAVATHASAIKDLPTADECPIVYKVHGDYLADNQKHLPEETVELEAEMQQRLVDSFKQHDLVVVGYSGNDKSVISALGRGLALRDSALVYWLLFGSEEPSALARSLGDQVRFHRIQGHEAFWTTLRQRILARQTTVRDDPRIRACFYLGRTNVTLLAGDITEVASEALVSSDDTFLTMGGGVSAAIRRRAGQSVRTDAQGRRLPLELGQVVATGAGDLADQGVRYIMHAGVVRQAGYPAEAETVARATFNALQAAEERGIQTIAFPALGTGTGLMAAEACAVEMIETVLRYVQRDSCRLRQVIFVVQAGTEEGFVQAAVRRLGGRAQLDRLRAALAQSTVPEVRHAADSIGSGERWVTADPAAAAAILHDLSTRDEAVYAVTRETIRYCWAVWQTELCRLLHQRAAGHPVPEEELTGWMRQLGALERANPTVF